MNFIDRNWHKLDDETRKKVQELLASAREHEERKKRLQEKLREQLEKMGRRQG
ncbi:hypothetical protein [Thermoactinomyces sp. CICC 10521]|uniref:hypothetical protein n=1 Tax=Thermoactinomyces sp. CICC 10521 TaxID=2767426 RepID=UPI0018DD1041|nr:hypothetical protein [Thermoactinomyces sp. CICC 10521]MBH8606013.1 hypothetical protein [Thermoactinomyces sp. CICC 10521]